MSDNVPNPKRLRSRKKKLKVVNKSRNEAKNGSQNKQNAKNKVAPIKSNHKKKEEQIFPDSLRVLEPLKPNYFYSRHFYLFRYVVKPTIYSFSACLVYSVPWVTLIIMLGGFSFDLVMAKK